MTSVLFLIGVSIVVGCLVALVRVAMKYQRGEDDHAAIVKAKEVDDASKISGAEIDRDVAARRVLLRKWLRKASMSSDSAGRAGKPLS
jgi:hypothetical protein